MATNDRRLSMFSILFSFISFNLVVGGVSAGPNAVLYQIANANRLALRSEAFLHVSFGEGGTSARFKRQAPADPTGTDNAGMVDGGAINADAPTTSINGNQTLPDDDNSPGSSILSNSSDATTSPMTTTTPTPRPPTTVDPFKDSDIIHDQHRYYESSIFKDSIDDYWVELETTPRHETLSDGHRVAVVIPLKFKFYFYGHPVMNVTVATGGFIYMSPFLHQWLTATQYIAPLMANFDPSFGEGSSIYYKSYDTRFIVEWRDVVLKDQNSTGKFNFQVILKEDSSITFAYKTVPVSVSAISSDQHPVKIGLSDAYYNDTYIPQFNVKKRTIYEYHKVVVPTNTVMSGTVVVLSSLPTCNRLDSCDSCTKHSGVSFDCRWCNKIGRCSDGLDWFRQHWDLHGCKQLQTRDTSVCASLPPPSHPIIDPLTPIPVDKCADGKCKDKSDFPVAVVVVIVLALVGLFGSIGAWVFYAYTHPTSRSGMWLMEHRPSQIKAKIKFWKSSNDSSAKYKADSEA